MNRINRVTSILIQLQSKKIIPAKEIAQRFNISLRTVYRDIRTLEEAGIPIGSEAGKGYFLVEGFLLPPVMFTAAEVGALITAGKFLNCHGDESFIKDFDVVANSEGEPLSYTQFKRLWQYIVTRTVKERSYYRYENGKRVKHTVKPVLGERAAHNGKVVYSLDFEVTPHLLRHTYITNLIHASVDPKTVQYLAGHENSKITMDIYAKAKYNRPDELAGILEDTFTLWDAE